MSPSDQSHPIDFIRKKPSQERAKVTVDAIVEATIQLLGTNTHSKITTNQIAARAGISVGTLYQYFKNKDEILSVILKQYRRELVAAIGSGLENLDLTQPDQVIPQVVRVLIESFRSILTARKSMTDELSLLTAGKSGVHFTAVAQLIQQSTQASPDNATTNTQLSDVGTFVLTRAVIGVIHNAMRDDPELLDDPEFEAQLIRLVTGFFKQ